MNRVNILPIGKISTICTKMVAMGKPVLVGHNTSHIVGNGLSEQEILAIDDVFNNRNVQPTFEPEGLLGVRRWEHATADLQSCGRGQFELYDICGAGFSRNMWLLGNKDLESALCRFGELIQSTVTEDAGSVGITFLSYGGDRGAPSVVMHNHRRQGVGFSSSLFLYNPGEVQGGELLAGNDVISPFEKGQFAVWSENQLNHGVNPVINGVRKVVIFTMYRNKLI